MKIWQGVSLLLFGVSTGFLASRFTAVPPVHAQWQASETGLCVASVPKSWGEFRGASGYGLAFEDQDGTIRFLRNPSCESEASSTSNPLPLVDLKVGRK